MQSRNAEEEIAGWWWRWRRSFVGSRSAVWVWSSGRRSASIVFVPGRCPDQEKGEKEQLESSYSVGPM
jgi:hypothetical protein